MVRRGKMGIFGRPTAKKTTYSGDSGSSNNNNSSSGSSRGSHFIPSPEEVPGFNMTDDQQELINKEDNWRRLFSEDPHNSEIQDLHVGLTNVFENRDLFKYEAETEEEKKVPKVLTTKRRQNLVALCRDRTPSIVNRDEFINGWKEFTQNMFQGLNWNNVFIAGGSIVANVLSSEDGKQGFKGSDIDIFIYGITNDQEANDKLRHIYEVVKKNSQGGGEVIRSGRAITILGKYPNRHVQIITRLYKSPSEVLMGFDIDCCTIGYDGKDLWAAERFIRSVNKCYNLVNITRRSITYESRLYKYSKRGFAVAVPKLDKTKIDEELFNNPYDMRMGLAKLLNYDYYQRTSGYQSRYTSLAWSVRRRLGKSIGTLVDDFNHDRLEDFSIITNNKLSDYSEAYLPWGPNWRPSDVMKIMEQTDKASMFGLGRNETSANLSNNNNQSKSGKRKLTVPHRHLFVSGLEGVISGNVNVFWCQHCHDRVPLEDGSNSNDNQSKYIKGPLVWVRESTAYQDIDKGFRRTLITGSFNPLPDEDWEKDVYQSKSESGSTSGSASGSVGLSKFTCGDCNCSFLSLNQLNKHKRDLSHYSDSNNNNTSSSSSSINNNSISSTSSLPKPSLEFTSYSSGGSGSGSGDSFILGTQPGMSVNSYPQAVTPSKFGGPSGISHTFNESPNIAQYTPQPSSLSSNIGSTSGSISATQYNVPSVFAQSSSSYSYSNSSSRNVPWAGKDISIMAKGFLVVGLLFREGKINDAQRTKLKNSVMVSNPVLSGIIEAFEISEDLEDLTHSMLTLSIK